MKRVLLITTCLLLITFGASTISFADIWTNTVDLDRLLIGSGTFSWQHDVTTDFSIPYDTLNSATLTISAWGVDNNNDHIFVQGVSQGALNSDGMMFFEWVTWTNYNIGAAFTSGWASGAPLDVTLVYNETQLGSLRSLFLDTSTLTIDYANRVSAVPEPGTLMLILLAGPVLAVTAGFRERIKKRQQ